LAAHVEGDRTGSHARDAMIARSRADVAAKSPFARGCGQLDQGGIGFGYRDTPAASAADLTMHCKRASRGGTSVLCLAIDRQLAPGQRPRSLPASSLAQRRLHPAIYSGVRTLGPWKSGREALHSNRIPSGR
jgi:hypothetical protein